MAKLKTQLESILFVANRPLSLRELANFLKEDKRRIKEELEKLQKEYQEEKRGIAIVSDLSKYEMVVSAEGSSVAKKFLKEEISGELSQAALETLTIIAYRGPLAKAELEQVRGVNCGLILRNLSMRGLVDFKKGRELKKFFQDLGEGIKKDILQEEKYYYVTLEFLRHLGIDSWKDLPDYEELNKIEIN